MIGNAFRSLLAEPRAPDAPTRVWRDWALVAVLVPTALLEGVFRDDLPWRPLSTALAIGVVLLTLWRRTRPVLVLVLAFGMPTIVEIWAAVSDVDWEPLATSGVVVILPYALARWGAGREIVVGLTSMLVLVLISITVDFTTVGDFAGAIVIVLFPAALGALIRYRSYSVLREIEQAKLLEREQLARELHDTVAHHVSAIAVQAQAGRTIAASRPEAAVDALEVIEEEASRALTEMRSMVGALRRDGEPELAPQPGVADIRRLADRAADIPLVDVELAGDLGDLGPSLDTALYRLAQESITNAVRHARRATRIDVRVVGLDDHVRLTVRDDGEPPVRGSSLEPGYGLVGMSERAALLGGTLEAGPGANGGWTVEATLPRNGAAG